MNFIKFTDRKTNETIVFNLDNIIAINPLFKRVYTIDGRLFEFKSNYIIDNIIEAVLINERY